MHSRAYCVYGLDGLPMPDLGPGVSGGNPSRGARTHGRPSCNSTSARPARVRTDAALTVPQRTELRHGGEPSAQAGARCARGEDGLSGAARCLVAVPVPSHGARWADRLLEVSRPRSPEPPQGCRRPRSGRMRGRQCSEHRAISFWEDRRGNLRARNPGSPAALCCFAPRGRRGGRPGSARAL